MQAIGLEAYALDDFFPQDTLDIVWLPKVAEKGWSVLTRDHGIRTNFVEIDAIMTHRVGMFLLPKKLTGEAYADLTAMVHRRPVGIASERSGPFIYSVQPNGRVERRDTDEWLEPWRSSRVARGLPPLIR